MHLAHRGQAKIELLLSDQPSRRRLDPDLLYLDTTHLVLRPTLRHGGGRLGEADGV